MKRPSEKKQHDENAVVEGEDAKGAAGVEGFEEVREGACVEQDAGDEKAGENEEEVDAEVAGLANAIDEIQKFGAGVWIGREEVEEEDHEDGKSSDSVERWNVLKTTGIFGIAGGSGLRGGGRRHVWIIGYLQRCHKDKCRRVLVSEGQPGRRLDDEV